jgi:hypothetical protein
LSLAPWFQPKTPTEPAPGAAALTSPSTAIASSTVVRLSPRTAGVAVALVARRL